MSQFPVDLPPTMLRTTLYTNKLIGNIKVIGNITSNIIIAENIYGNLTSNNWYPGNISGLTVNGNVTASYFIGNGALLSGINATSLPTAANIDIVGNVSAPGNVNVAGQVNVTGNVVGNYFLGNGALLSGITASTLPATANIDIIGNVTAPGNVVVAGQVNVTGNVTGNYFFGNGALLSGVTSTLPLTANIDIIGNVSAPGNVVIAGQVNVTGNVAGNYFLGNGALLTDITPKYTANGSTITTGNLILTTDKYFAVNASNTSVLLSAVGVNTGGNLAVLANNGYISQNNLNGYLLIPQGYVQDEANRLALGGGNAPIGTFVTQVDNGNSYILTASPSNISNSWLTFTGANFPVNTVFGRVGDVIATYADYTDTLVTLAAPVGTIPAGNSVAQALQSLQATKANIVGGAVGALFLGNLIGDFANVTTLIGTTGNVGNVIMAGGNVAVSGQINAIGNVVAPFFVGNGSQLIGVTATLPLTANLDIGGNVIGAYANVANVIAEQGNVGNVRMVGGNIEVSGQINTLGNVVAPFFIGNGSQLTGITGFALPSTANIDINGNVIGAFANVVDVIADQGNVGNVRMVGGNVVASFFIGNGSQLTGLSGLPGTGNIDISGNVIGAYANVANVIAEQGNVGNVRMIDGNVMASFFIGNGSQLTGLSGLPGTGNIDISGNVIGEYANVANVIAVQGNVGGILLEGGNVSGEYANVVTVTSVYGNIGGVFFIDNTVNIGTGGVTIQNGDIIITNGNISAQYYTGNGALMTGILTTLPATANIDIRGNVTGNTIITETITASANLTVSGRAGVTGNVTTGEYFIGNGYYMTLNGLTLIPQGNVANAAVRLALNVPAGTLVTQTDINTQYLLTALPASSNINWLEFTGTNFPVPSVFGRTGAITAFPNDYLDSFIQLSANVGTTIANVDHVSDALAYLDINKANVVNGNITAGYFLGNGALLTGITSALPSVGNIDIRGNVFGAFANVIQVITSNLRVSSNTVSLGLQAGNLTQGLGAIAIGPNAAHLSQGTSAVAIGANAASVNQGSQAIAIGRTAGTTSQGASSIAIGSGAAITSQGASSIAIGVGAAATSQSTQTIAIGRSAGSQSQGVQGIALGDQTATISQGIQAIAIGSTAGQSNQGRESIAIGTAAGQTSLGTHSIAIGRNAGGTGGNAITMGHYATADFANSIVISAGGTSLAPVSSPGVGTLTINPIRGNAVASSQFLMYNTTTKEVSYNTSGNVSAVYFLGNGALMTGVTASLPTSGNIDIRGNVIGTYANVDQVITSNLSVTSELVSIGFQAGNSGQGFSSVAIGANAAPLNQGPEAVAIGSNSAYTSQGSYAVAIGRNAGGNSQGVQAVAVGDGAGRLTQGTAAVAVGLTAGTSSQGISGVAVGFSAGRFTQGAQAVAIGDSAGLSGQGTQAIAIGTSAGSSNQGAHSIAIGRLAGGLGSNAIAIGHNAQANLSNSIVISAWGNGGPLYSSGDGTLTIAPIRGNAIASTTMLMYNTTTREVSYNTSGNITAPFFFGNGSQLTGLTASTLPSVANLDIRGNVTAPGNITVAGQVNVVGNVSANYFIGNGALLTGVTATLPTTVPADIRGNLIGAYANVANVIAVQGNVGNTRFLGGNVAVSGQINTLGNVVAPFFIGNGSRLTGVTATLPLTANLDIGGNVIGAFANVANIIAVQGNVGNTRFLGGNVAVSGQINTLGNIVAPFLIGNIIATQGNIGNVRMLNGNITTSWIFLSNTTVGPGTISSTTGFIGNVELAQDSIFGCKRLIISGDTFDSSINGATFRKNNGEVEFGDVRIRGQVVTLGNIVAGGQVNVTGNVVAPFFLGNGALLSGVTPTLPALANIDIRGNVIGAFANVANVIAVQGNVGNTRFLGGNVAVSGQVNVLGNVVSPFFVGNGSRLTGVVADTLPSVITANIIGSISGGSLVRGHELRGNTLYIPDNTLGSFIGTTTFDTAGDISTNDIQAGGNVVAYNDIQASFGNIRCNKFVFGNAFFMTGIEQAALPDKAFMDLEGNVIGAYANVANIIAAQGNVASVIFDAGNVTTSGFLYQGIRSATFSGDGSQAGTTTTPNIAVQFPTTTFSTGTLDLTRQNTNTRFINLSSSTRLFQVNVSIPFSAVDGGTSGRGVQAFIQYTSAGGAQVKIAAAADARPNMNAGNDKGQILNMGAVVTLEPNGYFELFANSMLTVTNVVNTSLTNAVLTNPVITIAQLN
jgi:hypothetical protein